MPHQPSELAQKLTAYLDCPCEVFAPMQDDDPILEAFAAAKKEGEKQGYFPILMPADEIWIDCLWQQAQQLPGEGTDLERLRRRRQALLSAPQPDGKAYLEEMMTIRRRELAEKGMEWTEFMATVEGGETIEGFSVYWNPETNRTDETVLAKIPVKYPWEIFAWMPMEDTPFFPTILQKMAIARRWYHQYGAVAAAFNVESMEFAVEHPVADRQQAIQLAQEQYAFCPERVEQCTESGTLGELIDSLLHSKTWFFWWQ